MYLGILYNLKIPANNDKGYYNLFVSTNKHYELEELKKELINSNKINEDLKEDIEFVSEYSIENYGMKMFFIKNGFKVIDLQ